MSDALSCIYEWFAVKNFGDNWCKVSDCDIEQSKNENPLLVKLFQDC